MTPNDAQLKEDLERDEGRRNDLYVDTKGIPSTGIGHNFNAKPIPNDWTFPLTDAQVDQLYDEDMTEVFDELDMHLPWWRDMTDNRQAALANMCFNMGINVLLEFHNTLAAMEQGRYNAAAAGMQASKWAKEVHARADRLETLMVEG